MYDIKVNVQIRRLREIRNISQDHIAQALGVSRATYTRMENEDTFDYTHLLKIVDEYDVPLEFLLSGDESLLVASDPIKGHSIVFSDVASEIQQPYSKKSDEEK